MIPTDILKQLSKIPEFLQLNEALGKAKRERSDSGKTIYLIRNASGKLTVSAQATNKVSKENLEELGKEITKKINFLKTKIDKSKLIEKAESLVNEAILYQSGLLKSKSEKDSAFISSKSSSSKKPFKKHLKLKSDNIPEEKIQPKPNKKTLHPKKATAKMFQPSKGLTKIEEEEEKEVESEEKDLSPLQLELLDLMPRILKIPHYFHTIEKMSEGNQIELKKLIEKLNLYLPGSHDYKTISDQILTLLRGNELSPKPEQLISQVYNPKDFAESFEKHLTDNIRRNNKKLIEETKQLLQTENKLSERESLVRTTDYILFCKIIAKDMFIKSCQICFEKISDDIKSGEIKIDNEEIMKINNLKRIFNSLRIKFSRLFENKLKKITVDTSESISNKTLSRTFKEVVKQAASRALDEMNNKFLVS